MKFSFVSDLHGSEEKYLKLIEYLQNNKVDALFNGGDLLPSGVHNFTNNGDHENFISQFLIPKFLELKNISADRYPEIFLIMGNDDARIDEEYLKQGEQLNLWHYIHNRKITVNNFDIYGYAFVPPTPFQLKDWEKYDVSRFVDPGCVSPEEGIRTVSQSELHLKYSTIKDDLEKLTKNQNLGNAIFLFHSPPYQTNLDKADLAGKVIDHAPVDAHVGSIAIKRFIEKRQPLITMHGHIHESTRMTGKWKDRIGKTFCFNSAHDGDELCIISFDPTQPENAERFLL